MKCDSGSHPVALVDLGAYARKPQGESALETLPQGPLNSILSHLVVSGDVRSVVDVSMASKTMRGLVLELDRDFSSSKAVDCVKRGVRLAEDYSEQPKKRQKTSHVGTSSRKTMGHVSTTWLQDYVRDFLNRFETFQQQLGKGLEGIAELGNDAHRQLGGEGVDAVRRDAITESKTFVGMHLANLLREAQGTTNQINVIRTMGRLSFDSETVIRVMLEKAESGTDRPLKYEAVNVLSSLEQKSGAVVNRLIDVLHTERLDMTRILAAQGLLSIKPRPQPVVDALVKAAFDDTSPQVTDIIGRGLMPY